MNLNRSIINYEYIYILVVNTKINDGNTQQFNLINFIELYPRLHPHTVRFSFIPSYRKISLETYWKEFRKSFNMENKKIKNYLIYYIKIYGGIIKHEIRSFLSFTNLFRLVNIARIDNPHSFLHEMGV